MKQDTMEFEEELDDFDQDEERTRPIKSALDSIQVLRGIAALMVGFAHLHAVETKLGGPMIFGNIFLNGFAGVDLFFLISGFIMFYTNRDSKPGFGNSLRFWGLRLFRIYPLWILVCGAIYVVYLYRPEWVYGSHNSHPDILKSFLLIPQTELPLHAVGWTLIHELWFYFVFGILMLAPRNIFLPLVLVWGLLTMAGGLQPSQDPWVLLITHPLTFEFITGIICAMIFLGLPKKSGLIILVIGVLAFLIAINSVGENPSEFFADRENRVSYFTIPFAFILVGIASLENSGVRFPKTLKRLGDWSYSYYLLHVPVFALVGRLGVPFSNPNSLIDNIVFAIIAMATTIIASAITYMLIEKPVMKLAHHLLAKKSVTTETN